MTGATPVSWDCRGREFPASLRMASAGSYALGCATATPLGAVPPFVRVSHFGGFLLSCSAYFGGLRGYFVGESGRPGPWPSTLPGVQDRVPRGGSRSVAGPWSNAGRAKTANTTPISEHQQDKVEIVVQGDLVSSRKFQAGCPLTVAPMDSCMRWEITPPV